MSIPTDPYKFARRFKDPRKALSTLDDHPDLGNHRAADFLRRVTQLPLDYRNNFLRALSQDDLVAWMKNPPIISLSFFYELRVLPTPNVVRFVNENPYRTKEALEEVIVKMHNGGFDIEDDLHRELELGLKTPFSRDTSRFDNLPWYDEDVDFIITDWILKYVQGTAEEAVAVLELCRKKSTEGPLLVIGNQRYGAQFVVEPIAGELQELGITIKYDHISSTHRFLSNLNPEIKDYIRKKQPNVIVVDGTKEFSKDGMSRFPAAMHGYIKFFREINEESITPMYRFDFWAPELRETIVIGDHEYCHDQIDGEKEVIFVSAAHVRSIAMFDDIEMLVGENNIRTTPAVSRDGLINAPIARSVKIYAAEIKRLVKAYVLESNN